MDEQSGNWIATHDWKVRVIICYIRHTSIHSRSQAHDAAVSKICWAHPEFGSIIASSSFDRTVKIWNLTSGTANFSLEAHEKVVAGSDDFQLRVFNYNTHEKVAAFEAHPDYTRCLTVHPTASILLTGSDDMTIKAWDWERGCVEFGDGNGDGDGAEWEASAIVPG